MSNLPTLYLIDTPLNDQIGMIAELQWAGVLVPVTEPLLTRVEAANDPEVQEMVYRQWQRQNEAPTVYSEVTDDE